MNLVAHAALAQEYSAAPLFILGALAPDLLSMAGQKSAIPFVADDPQFHDGVRFHLATDLAFHQTATFLSAMRQETRRLEHLGFPKGPRRAVAHVGLELLLDGIVMERDPQLDATIRGALRAGIRENVSIATDPAAFRRTLQAVAEGTLLSRYSDPDFVAERILRILARRPRLAVSAQDTSKVTNFIHTLVSSVERWAAPLLDETRGALRFR